MFWVPSIKTCIALPYRYFLRVTIVRRLSDLVKEYELIVHQLATYPDVNNSIKMEVGIEDCLHIEFEYNKSKLGQPYSSQILKFKGDGSFFISLYFC